MGWVPAQLLGTEITMGQDSPYPEIPCEEAAGCLTRKLSRQHFKPNTNNTTITTNKKNKRWIGEPDGYQPISNHALEGTKNARQCDYRYVDPWILVEVTLGGQYFCSNESTRSNLSRVLWYHHQVNGFREGFPVRNDCGPRQTSTT